MEREMTLAHIEVLEIIKNAENNIVTREEVLRKLNKPTSYGRQLSMIIQDLIIDFDEPIGSGSSIYKRGYFYCKTDMDYMEAINSLSSRIESINSRISKLNDMRGINVPKS